MAAVDTRQLWQNALGELQIQMRPEDFRTWFRNTSLVSVDGATCVVGVENPFSLGWLSSKCRVPVARTLQGLLGRDVDVAFIVEHRDDGASPAPPLTLSSPPIGPTRRARPARSVAQPEMPTAPWYTFDTFVVGDNCKLAHAASMAVADRPGHAYNPLFIYGGVGLGKTHLLHAIGHAAQARGEEVVYRSSEAFTNDFVESIRRNRMEDFRSRYRYAGVLLVDDVQFIAGREQTQEEFFHTFNALHEAGRQIVLTSDRPPGAIGSLEERLRSRYAWGLITDVQPPDLETRVAILRTKAAAVAARRPETVIASAALDLIAERVRSNIRELEGALNRVLAYAELGGTAVTVDLAAAVLQDLYGSTPAPSPSVIIDAVCRIAGISAEEISDARRDRRVLVPRQIAMFLLREQTNLSLSEVGALLGGRDHSTVLHSCEKIAAEIQTDERRRGDVQAVRNRIAALAR